MTRRILLILAVWLLAATAAGGSGLWLRLPTPLAGSTLWLLVAALLLAWWRSPALAGWLREVDSRVLVLVHVTRLVGIWFLVLFQRGRLPFAFATPGGYGDILAAVGALVAIAALSVPVRARTERPPAPGVGSPDRLARGTVTGWRRAVLLLWNAFGLLDLLYVVGTAVRFALTRPAEIVELRELPLCLLPTFLVPILMFTHLVLFARFGPRRRLPGSPTPRSA